MPTAHVVDAETGEAVASDAGKLHLTLIGYDVRLLKINTP